MSICSALLSQHQHELISHYMAALCVMCCIAMQLQPPPFKTSWVLIKLSGKGLQPARERDCHWATLLETQEQLRSTSNDASTKLLRLDIKNVSGLGPEACHASALGVTGCAMCLG
jgi:hypothetical protein